ncbi:MAG: DoxX family membrane protein [Bacteroidetes bacterium]|nr:DoxX family membrane protein [Bacteroidota bacterium]
MKSLITVLRYFVGILFIFSGLVKANDPLGLAYKMQEFFEVWAQSGFLPGFMHALNNFALPFSIIMISFEIIAGVAVIVGWRMRLFSWLLLLLIIFFTFLTGYAYLSGKFRSCGCFGDCIPLTPRGSFVKDIFLTLFILTIFAYRNKIKPPRSAILSAGIIIISTLFSLWLQWHVLRHLPIADCLPFKKGNNIPEQMKIPQGAIPDSTVITFVYQKQGQTIEFTADNFPEDFDDSLYHFVKRYDKLVRKGNADAPIKDFVLNTLSGADTTNALLAAKGYSLLLFIKDDAGRGNWQGTFKKITDITAQKDIPAFIITNDIEDNTPYLKDINNLTWLRCDVVPIKTAARANPTLYLLYNGTIIDKWGFADFVNAAERINKINAR